MKQTESQTQRIVMLDFDGVLNKEYQYYSADQYQVDPQLAQRVGRLVTTLDAKVVISSDWRHFYDVPELQRILGHFAAIAPHRVLGTTPVPKRQGAGIRGQEIQRWLQDFGQPVRLAILDDNHEGRFCMNAVRRWFVQTDPFHGVSESDIQQAHALLTDGPVWEPVQSVAA